MKSKAKETPVPAEPAPPSLEARVLQLLELISVEPQTEAAMTQQLVDNAALIHSIAKECPGPRLWSSASAKWDQFVADLEADTAPERRLPLAWLYFLERAAEAPLRAHLKGVVRLYMPLIARYLPEPTTAPETSEQ